MGVVGGVPAPRLWLSVVGPTVCVMAEKRSSHLRVVRTPSAPPMASEVSRADTDPTRNYWAELQALRDERRRLRAG
jgi:hypothetical protein